MQSLHAKVMELYIFKHFSPNSKIMLRYSFKNSANEDEDIYRHRVYLAALLEYNDLYYMQVFKRAQ